MPSPGPRPEPPGSRAPHSHPGSTVLGAAGRPAGLPFPAQQQPRSGIPPPATRLAGYRGRMPPSPARPQLGLFDNPAAVFSLDELAGTVRKLERERPGRTVDELSRAVFAELAMKPTRRAAELVAEAIRLARAREPRAEITGSRAHASRQEVRNWALTAGFAICSTGTMPG